MCKKFLVFFVSLAMFFVSGCSAQEINSFIPPEDGFAFPEGIKDVNTSIRLAPLYQGKINSQTGTDLMVENVSNHELIYFSADTDVQLYYLQGNEWVPVKNNVVYYPSGDRYLRPPKAGVSQWLTISAIQILPDPDTKTKVRVLVIATVIEKDQPTDEKVAAYIDLWFEP